MSWKLRRGSGMFNILSPYHRVSMRRFPGFHLFLEGVESLTPYHTVEDLQPFHSSDREITAGVVEATSRVWHA